MANQIYCDPCSEDSKYLPAIRYCSDCEERLCKECVECHTRNQALTSHHLIEFATTVNKILSSTKKYCENHPNTILDFYCIQHDIPCCRTCISINHRICDNVLPLDVASKGIQNSSLLIDTFDDMVHLIEIVRKLHENRDANLKSLAQTKSLIKQQITTAISRLLKQINDLGQNLITQLFSLEGKNEAKIINQKIEISKLESRLTKSKQEFDFLKHHGSENHLFLAVRQLVIDNEKTETDIQRLVSSVEEISVKFDEVREHTFGTIVEINQPCTVQYKPPRASHAQFRKDVVNSLTVFETIGQINLKSGENYIVTDIAVTADGKLLVSNWHDDCPKVYMYKDCKDYEHEMYLSSKPYGIAVIPDTDTAVVTLPREKSMQFINITNMTKGDKVQLGFRCWGITATKDNIIVGGKRAVHILNRHGSRVTEVPVGGSSILSMHYDKVNNRLMCRFNGGMCCVTLEGKPAYQYKVSGGAGLAVDREGHVYLSHQPNAIHRLSSDGKLRDAILTRDNDMNYPYALSFNNDFTKLFVVHNRNKSVSVFRCI